MRIRLQQRGRTSAMAAAGDFYNDRLTDIYADEFLDATGAVVEPDMVTWGVTPAVGSVDWDGANPNHHAVFSPHQGYEGPAEFSLVTHQAGLSDYSPEPLQATFISPPPPPSAQITSGGSLSATQAAAVVARTTPRRR